MDLPEQTLQQVGETPGESIPARLTRQNKAIARSLKHPSNEPAAKMWEGSGPRKLPTVRHSYGRTLETPAGTPLNVESMYHIVNRLHGIPMGDDAARPDDGARSLDLTDLYRAYKYTPHQPASVYLKYLVHRLNNMDAYEDPAQGIGEDLRFLEHHKKGGAAEKNGHLVPKDFHVWMHTHPTMPEQLLAHKAALHAELARGVGLNIRDIAGQPYVALSRGLNTDIMNHEHALSSWSDLVDPGFGKFTNHAWVPLKDLWYSYQHGPEEAGGNVGHENEYLVSHTAPRFEAEPHDVKSVRGHGNPRFYDNATDAELARYAANDPDLLSRPGAGPETFNAVRSSSLSPEATTAYIAKSKFMSREEALGSPIHNSIQNPNLTAQDVGQKVLQFSAANTLDASAVHQALYHPSATADTARTLASQYVPDGTRDHILDELAASPLTPPDVLDQVVAKAGGTHAGRDVLRNPNHTSVHADAIARARDIGKNPDLPAQGRYSAQLINEMSDEVGAGYGQEPTYAKYPSGTASVDYQAALDKFLAAKYRFASIYNGLVTMASNRDLSDDAQDALIDAIERHELPYAFLHMASRQNQVPMSETQQLRLLRALGSVHHQGGREAAVLLAKSKGLAPSTVWALALHHDPHITDTLFRNHTVDFELLAKAWPENKGTPKEYADRVYVERPGDVFEGKDPYYNLARAIEDRRAYAARRAVEHLIKPWPKNMAKSETDWWPVKLREWMSKRAKPERGYYLRVPNMELAQFFIKERVISTQATDEVLDGYVVMAYPAKDLNFHAWEQDPDGGDVLLYFETDSPPTPHEGKVYWPHEVHTTDARIAGIRPTGDLTKGEGPISRASAFNGEKDYRPDESGASQFPLLGGPKKEKSPESEGLKLPGGDLKPGEYATALAQLGHNDRFGLVLAAACFLARKPFDQEKFQQGLAIYGDEVRAALHAVDLSDSEKNMRAMGAVINLQGGQVKALSKSEDPQPVTIHSIQPGNEDAVDTAEAVERAVRSGTVVALKLNGKHSKGAMACRDPRSGRVYLLKPGSGKQSPAAGARDGKASQSRREAAFWHVADKVHLGGVIPKADLLIVNAQEWAAIKLLGSDWKSLDEKNREKTYKGREVLGPYLANGQLHRWAVLDWVLGNTDSHGQNLLVNAGGSVALIDHGAAFAGEHFDPSHDTKSFIPFYLRVWAPETDFKKKTPADRVIHMPSLARYEDDVLKRWLVEDFTPQAVERELRKYGIDEEVTKAVLARLQELRSAPGNLSRTVNALWAGSPVPKGDFLG